MARPKQLQGGYETFVVSQGKAREIVQRYNAERLWDNLKARDVPAEVLEFAKDQLEAGFGIQAVRRQLGIKSALDKSWVKIASALRGGTRVDASAFFLRMQTRCETVAQKLYEFVDQALTDPEKMAVIGKEVTMACDAMNRMQQGMVKVGRELGVFETQGEGGKSGGTTIIVQSNVNLPSQSQIDSRRKDIEAKGREITEPKAAIPEQK